MSKYIKKRRSPGAEDTWGHQGSVESLSGDDIDGPNDRRFVGGQDVIYVFFFFRRLWLIKGVCGCVRWRGGGGFKGVVLFLWEIRIVKSDSESSSFVKKSVAELDGAPSSLVSSAPRRSRVEEKFKRCPQP